MCSDKNPHPLYNSLLNIFNRTCNRDWTPSRTRTSARSMRLRWRRRSLKMDLKSVLEEKAPNQPAQLNNGGASKKSQQAENEKSKKIKTDQQINQNLNPILIPKDVNNDKENEMIKKNVNGFDKQNKLAKKEANSSLEKQKKETKIRKELEGRLSDLSESEISELVSKLMDLKLAKTGTKRTEQINQMANLIKGSKIPFETESGK